MLTIIIAMLAMFFLAYSVMRIFDSANREDKAVVTRRLAGLRNMREAAAMVDIERRRSLSSLGWLHDLLASLTWTRKMDLILEQGQVRMTLGRLVLISLALGSVTFAIVFNLYSNIFLIMAPPLAMAYIPFMRVFAKRNKRMGKFQRQLPDALDLIARALKAGHAFNQGLRMVADEFDDPIGPEFQKMLEEINFGIPMDVALFNLTRRVDCPDLKFFVVSVNIQRETGGNLAEIVTNIARLIRDRFKLAGRVRVLSAEGRLTAWILFALPFGIGFIINFLNPEFMSALYETPEGNMLMTASLFQMAVGGIILKRMTTIRV